MFAIPRGEQLCEDIAHDQVADALWRDDPESNLAIYPAPTGMIFLKWQPFF